MLFLILHWLAFNSRYSALWNEIKSLLADSLVLIYHGYKNPIFCCSNLQQLISEKSPLSFHQENKFS